MYVRVQYRCYYYYCYWYIISIIYSVNTDCIVIANNNYSLVIIIVTEPLSSLLKGDIIMYLYDCSVNFLTKLLCTNNTVNNNTVNIISYCTFYNTFCSLLLLTVSCIG